MGNLNSYGGAVAAVEQERRYLSINNRYPYVMLCGPNTEMEVQTYNTGQVVLPYIIKYIVNVNDESQVENTEISYLVRMVVGDIVKVLMVDPQRNSLAQMTNVMLTGYSAEAFEDTMNFFVYVGVEVVTIINPANPYQLG